LAQKANKFFGKYGFNNINVMESNIAGAKARLWNAEQNLNRYKNLLASEAVTRQQYDQVKTEYDAQKAAYETLVNQKQSANLSTTEVKSKLGLMMPKSKEQNLLWIWRKLIFLIL
jgi:multidrug resistance efflux pump